MATLDDVLPGVLATANELKKAGQANEANTRVHVIEPVIAALGWNLKDFNEVGLEYKCVDGTFLDYALRINGEPKLFVEAKALGKSLADIKFIKQTVDYANGEGVVWCVLTNGLVYQVYKSNEVATLDRKLLFEVDLADAEDPANRSQVITALQMLSRSSLQAGNLDSWGDTVFVDTRVRGALAKLGTQPPRPLLTAVASALEGQPVTPEALKASIARVLGQLAAGSTGALVGTPPPSNGTAVAKDTGPGVPAPTKSAWSIDSHTAKKPTAIINLFESVNSLALSLGPDVQRRPVKYYIGYFAGKKSSARSNCRRRRFSCACHFNRAKSWPGTTTPCAMCRRSASSDSARHSTSSRRQTNSRMSSSWSASRT